MLSPRVQTPGRSRFAPPHITRAIKPPDGGSKVRVVVRVRPFLPSEIDAENSKPTSCVSISKCTTGTEQHDTLHISDPKTSRNESYKLDFCYVEQDDISLIFAKEMEPILPILFRGCNATVFAYGATGSGKTYTMQGLEDRPGLMPLALASILSTAQKTNSRVEVSYYEIYMDKCYDLLVEEKAVEVSVLEDTGGKIQMRGLSQVRVKTLEEFREVFVNGCLRRRVGQTGLNDASSRSHGVLMVTVTTYEGNLDNPLVGKLNLIDLAGNEDNRRTGNEGVRLAESARINQSLFALSNVINALNANEIRVPYRDSKLTRILQDSLGGTSRALMIACLNPKSYQEATHTLSLAARSRQIVNQSLDKEDPLSVKVDMGAKLQAWLEAKGKAFPRPAASPSPLKAKPFYTPHRLNFGHTRKNLPVEAQYAIPKARRVLVPNVSSSALKQDRGQEKDVNSGLGTAETCIAPGSSTNHNPLSGCVKEIETQIVAFRGTEKEEAVSCKKPPIDADDATLQVLPFTPKVINGSSSPPLSVRLLNLQTAMKEVLCTGSSTDLIKSSSCESHVELPPSLSPATSCENHVELRPLLSPAVTPQKLSLEERTDAATPLEKFSRNSSGIKNSLMKEYLEFLNTASREELLELRGIGEKRAAYILSLRETSPEPLKEIQDLEKIGLSAKQARNIFKKTARQIFS